jgi:cell division septum initiation protein DivIVA
MAQQVPVQPGATEDQMPLEQQQQVKEFIDYLKANRPDVLEKISKLPEEQKMPVLLEMMQTAQAEGQQPAPSQAQPSEQPPPQITPDAGVPVESDPQAIKQQLIAIAQAQQA